MTEPRNCYLWFEYLSTKRREKADLVSRGEGSSPADEMASLRDTTGVYEQGMHSEG